MDNSWMSDHKRIDRRIARVEKWAMRQSKQKLADELANVFVQFMALKGAYKASDELNVAARDIANDWASRYKGAIKFARGIDGELTTIRKASSDRGVTAADTRHSAPGGSREKRKAIQAVWASGKYDSRDRCAEEECGALGVSFTTARKALRNTPKPTRPLRRKA